MSLSPDTIRVTGEGRVEVPSDRALIPWEQETVRTLRAALSDSGASHVALIIGPVAARYPDVFARFEVSKHYNQA